MQNDPLLEAAPNSCSINCSFTYFHNDVSADNLNKLYSEADVADVAIYIP